MNAALLSTTQNPLVVPNGLIGFWSMNGGSGSFVQDFSGNNRTGSIIGANFAWKPGISGGGLYMTQSTYVYVGQPSVFDTPAFSCCAWVYSGINTVLSSIIVCSNQVNYGYSLNINQVQAGTYQAGYAAGWVYTGTWHGCGTTSSVVPLNTWVHLALTYGPTFYATLYVNGMRHAQVGPYTTLQYNSNTLTFGKEASYPTQVFSGIMDDVRIYNRELNAAEVQQIYLAT